MAHGDGGGGPRWRPACPPCGLSPRPGPRLAAGTASSRAGAARSSFNLAFTPHFAALQTLNVNLTQVCTIVIVGVGMTLVIATGGIDLSVGSLMAIAGALAPLIFLGKLLPLPRLDVGVALAFVVPVLVAGAFGLFNGWLVTRFASSRSSPRWSCSSPAAASRRC